MTDSLFIAVHDFVRRVSMSVSVFNFQFEVFFNKIYLLGNEALSAIASFPTFRF